MTSIAWFGQRRRRVAMKAARYMGKGSRIVNIGTIISDDVPFDGGYAA